MNLLSVSSVLSGIGAVLLAVLILLAMITVHEFGHYAAGKALGFKINEFAVGFGPALFKRKSKKSGEVFSVRAVPLGGYCAFAGEDGEESNKGGTGLNGGVSGEVSLASKESFTSKPPWKRIIVLISGALMNYVTAVILIIICFLAFGQTVIQVNGVTYPEGYTAMNSFAAGDIILEADGGGVYLTTDLMEALSGKAEGDWVAFTVERGGKDTEINVTLRGDCDFENSADTSKLWSALGVDTELKEDGNHYWQIGTASYRFPVFDSIGRAFAYSFEIAGTIFRVLGELLTGNIGLNAMGGPVTTIKLTSQLATQSVQSFLEIAAYIGVNLAVFNLLPIPALDGSKVVFCLIEWIFRKPVPRKIEAAIHAAGFILILGFAVLVDILQFAACG